MALWTIKFLESKSWVFFRWIWRESKEMLFLVHKNWERKSVNRFLGALRASNWLFMVVGVLMIMAILWILEEDEGGRVKYAFSKEMKKNDGIFVNNLNFEGERIKSKFKKKTWVSFVFDFKFWVIFAKKNLKICTNHSFIFLEDSKFNWMFISYRMLIIT